MPDKHYEVIIAPEATDRMFEHFRFLAQVSESAAQALRETLIRDIRSLEEAPFINPPFERPFVPRGKYRYRLSGKRYRIVYEIAEAIVYVEDIQDCRRDDDKTASRTTAM